MAARASYSALFGFDAERRGRWLALLQLDDATARAARELQERVIAPNLERTVDAFYRFLLSHPETRVICSFDNFLSI